MIKSMSNRELFQLEQAERTSRAFSNCLRKESQDQDVVKIGYLHIKRPPGNTKLRFKTWQKKYFILRDISKDDGVSTLEMYDTDSSYQQQSAAPEYKLDLKNLTRIETYDESKRFPSAFTVGCLGQIPPLTLGCYSAGEKNVWMEAVNVLADKRKLVCRYKDISLASEKERLRRSSLPSRIQYDVNPIYCGDGLQTEGSLTPQRTSGPPTPPRLYSTNLTDSGKVGDFVSLKCEGFLVKIQINTSASKNGLHGDYYMNVLSKCITLTTVEALKEVIKWPIQHITKFKSEDIKYGENLLTLEASMYSGLSEGSFKFRTIHGKELIKRVKDAASNTPFLMKRNKTSQQINFSNQSNHLLHSSLMTETSTDAATNSKQLLLTPGFRIERAHSSPNLLDVRVLINDIESIVTESNYECHSYLELVESEKDSQNPVMRQCADKPEPEVNDRRDSGFSDTESEDSNISNNTKKMDTILDKGLIATTTNTEEHIIKTEANNVDTTPSHSQASLVDNDIDSLTITPEMLQAVDNILNTPPPLPPKKKREHSAVFLDYLEDGSNMTSQSFTSNEDTPPPLPERLYNRTTTKVTEV